MKTNYPIIHTFCWSFLLFSILVSCKEIPEQEQKIKKAKRINGRMTDFLASLEYEHNLLKDPRTGRIPEGIHEKELKQAKEIALRQSRLTAASFFTFQGPDNLGGRTRSIVYDIRYNGTTNSTLFAGGVSGGVYKSTDNGATWIRKSPTGEHFSCTSIAQDPRPGFQDTWYYATGEASGNSASGTSAFYLGNGLYKSTDNGETWTRLVNSNTTTLETFNSPADLISKVAVNPVNGDVYMACIATIYRSQNGGSNWSAVLSGTFSTSTQMTDIVISSTGVLYAGFSGTNSNTVDGVWTSTTGNSGGWTRIAGTGAELSPAGWNAQGGYGRVVLALAPSNENILYALYYNNLSYPNAEAEFYKFNGMTTLWEDRSANLPDEPGGSSGNDPFAVQGGYDLVVAVKPDNENVVFIGGTNIYRSTDGFASTSSTTRIGGYVNASSYGMYTNSHPDIHAVAFQPGNPSVLICGNDGGIQRTSNCLSGTVSWTPINTGFRTFQYYYVAIDPRAGNNKVLGGAQDNGSTRNIGGSGSDMEMIMSGDGVAVGLSNLHSGSTYEYVGWQYGQIIRRNSTSGAGSGTVIRPGSATGNGLFITLFHLDPDNSEYLYYVNGNKLYRNSSASTATTSNWTEMTGTGTAAGPVNFTALATTRGNYQPATSSLFIGTSTAKIFRLDDPLNAAVATTPVNISTGLPASGYISSIAVNPRNDDTVLVCFSNYGMTNIWWTGNANSANPAWINVEGNITLPSIRSAAIVNTSNGIEYFVGTSVGLFKTQVNAASAATTTWAQEGISDIGNAVVTSLALRPADNRLLVGTHGYGMWSTSLSATILPVTLLDFKAGINQDFVRLAWVATSETSNGGFEIERSADGIHFKKIGYVKLSSGGLIANNYSYEDREPMSGNNYYRLKMFESAGAVKMSRVLLVKNQAVNNIVVTNPFKEHIDIRFDKIPSKLNISILHSGGNLILRRAIQHPGLSTRIHEVSTLPGGTYFLKIEADGILTTKKIIRQ